MAGITSTGFVNKTVSEIRQGISDLAQSDQYFGATFPVDANSVSGNLFTIISAALKESGWDLAQAVYDQFNRDKAEGKNLDDLAAYINLSRNQASPSTGQLLFTGQVNYEVPEETIVLDSSGNAVQTNDSLTYDISSCYSVTIRVQSILTATDYIIIVGDDTFTYTSSLSPTESEILSELQALISTQSNYASEIDSDGYLSVYYSSYNNGLDIILDNKLYTTDISSLTSASSIETGEIKYLSNSLTSLQSTPVGTFSVTNPTDFSDGSEEESDESLRLRMAEQTENTGTATKPAIEASIGEIDGVTSVKLYVNNTMETNSDGQPAKSIQLFVIGGDEDEIADVYWNTAPAGIETYGTTVKVFTDENGDEQEIYFTRPEEVFAWINVTYTLYNEEDFPDNGEDAISAALVAYGETLDVGTDLIPKRFASIVYDTVEGVDDVEVTLGVSDLSSTEPTYSSSRVPMDNFTVANYNTTRITVTLSS